MSRVAVESFLGAPRPDQLGPIFVQDGRATYQTTYPIDLDVGPPNTVRSAHPPRPPAPVGLTADCVLTLEFDASQPGHPLLSVRYPTELF